MFVATAAAIFGSYYVYDSIGPDATSLSRQLGLSDVQIGSLNAIYSLPNILLVLMGGLFIDRFGVRSVALCASATSLMGAGLTALGGSFSAMLVGRFLFGTGAETLALAIIVALAQWFAGRSFALFFALNLSLARAGSYLADRSPAFAHGLYDRGWRPPLVLAAGFAALSSFSVLVYWYLDRGQDGRGTLATPKAADRVEWRAALHFGKAYWYILGVCVAFYSVILPFRSTFAIKYFQQAHGMTLENASRLNSYVFMAAIFAGPAFGLLVARVGRHALLMVCGSLLLPAAFVLLGIHTVGLWVPTVLLGVSFSLVPAVLWPAVAGQVDPAQQGTAYGLMAMMQNIGLTLANVFAGHLNDHYRAGAANPEGYDAMLWFFGLLSLAGFVFASLLRWHESASRAVAR